MIETKKMLPSIDYSVAIRTLGNAGEMYASTIKSIAAQSVLPKEIIVVIDDANKIPALYKCGLERFVVKPRGMVRQRLYGIEENRSEWLLMLDDDVEFCPDFVAKMHGTAVKSKADVVIPIVRNNHNNLNIVNVGGWEACAESCRSTHGHQHRRTDRAISYNDNTHWRLLPQQGS